MAIKMALAVMLSREISIILIDIYFSSFPFIQYTTLNHLFYAYSVRC